MRPGAGGFGHLGEVKRGLALFHCQNEGVGELLDDGPVVVGLDGDDDVQALASGGLEKTFEAEALELVADFGGAGGERGPGDGGVGVEVDDEAVGVLEVVVARAPGMDFEDSELGEAGEGFGRGERDVRLDLAGLFVANVDRLDARAAGCG